MDENLYDVIVSINIVNCQSQALIQYLSARNINIVQEKAKIVVYVISKALQVSQVQIIDDQIQILLLQNEQQNINQYATFTFKQIDQLIDYCKFQQLVFDYLQAKSYSERSINIALVQKLKQLPMNSCQRLIVFNQNRYKIALKEADARLEQISRQRAAGREDFRAKMGEIKKRLGIQ